MADTLLPGQRGRSDHAMRERIIATAFARYRRDGLAQTSVADIAGDLGVTPAYVYKFFASKMAINEAVCGWVTGSVTRSIREVVALKSSASERIESLYTTLLKESVGLFFAERQLHDLVRLALDSDWAAVEQHKLVIRDAAATLIAEGVASGEFAADLDQEGASLAIWSSLFAFSHPAVLQSTINYDIEAHARASAALVLRALRCGASR